MVQPQGNLSDHWPKIEALIARAKKDPEFRDIFQFGTPSQKLEALGSVGLVFDDLVFIHRELETVLHNSPAKFWWW